MTYVEKLLSKFRNVRQLNGSEWEALSPLREETLPSLRISLASDGKILIRDFGGGSARAVLKAVGLDFRACYAGKDDEPITGGVKSRVGKLTEEPRLPESPFHDIYSEFLNEVILTEAHAKELRRRGVDPDAFDNLGYRTLSWLPAKKAIGLLIEKFSKERLLLTPGFRLASNGSIEPVLESGLLIPVRDLQGRIVALKVRTGESPKYKWFSGGGSPSCGSPCHFSSSNGICPVELTVVEGPLKADVVQALSDTLTLGIGGAAAWAGCLPYIAALKPEKLHLALDIDWQSNPGVAQSLLDLGDTLTDRGVVFDVWDWNPESGKGLDDVLMSKAAVEPMSWGAIRRVAEEVAGQAPEEERPVILPMVRKAENAAPFAGQKYAPMPSTSSVKEPSSLDWLHQVKELTVWGE